MFFVWNESLATTMIGCSANAKGRFLFLNAFRLFYHDEPSKIRETC